MSPCEMNGFPRRQKFRQKMKFAGLSYVMYQKTYGIQLGKICNPLEKLKATDRIRIPSDVHEDSDAHPIVCRFRAPNDPILAIANEDGLIELIDTSRSVLKPQKAYTPHKAMVSDISWLSKTHLLTATCPPKNQMGVFDLERGEEVWAKGRLHKGSVKVVAQKPQDTGIFVSGGRDGDIIVYDQRTDSPVLRVHGAHPRKAATGSRRSTKSVQSSYGITSLNFRDSNHLISTASGGGQLLVWDLRRSYNLMREPRPFLRLAPDGGGAGQQLCSSSGSNSIGPSTAAAGAAGAGAAAAAISSSNENTAFTYAIICPFRQTLYAQCSDNVIYAFDVNVYADKPVSIFYGHKAGRGEGAYFIKMDVSPSGRFLAIGSPKMDQPCVELPIPIFDTSRPGLPLCSLKGHYAEPSCPAWCTDLKLASCGDDQHLILWEPVGVDDEATTWGHCEVTEPEEYKNASEKWARLHQVYNTPVKGDSTPRVNRGATRSSTRSLSEWLKCSPASSSASAVAGPRSPLTPLRSLSGQVVASPPPLKRQTPQGGHDDRSATPATTTTSTRCSPHTPHTPKRRKLATPRSKPITGFFARQKAAESSLSKTPTSSNGTS